MQTFDVKCPVCGKVNRGLYLEETDGWMECEACSEVTRIRQADSGRLVPLYTVEKLRPLLTRAVQAI